jgi:hypothetical protein
MSKSVIHTEDQILMRTLELLQATSVLLARAEMGTLIDEQCFRRTQEAIERSKRAPQAAGFNRRAARPDLPELDANS